MLRRVVRAASIGVVALLACVGVGWIVKSHVAPGLDLSRVRIGFESKAEQVNLFGIEPFYAGSDSSLKEFGNARSDHQVIALAIAECDRANADPARWSDATRATLLFELDQNSMHTIHRRAVDRRDDIADALKLTPFQIGAISFSDRLSRDRLAYRRELEDNQDRARRYQIAILLLGALATIAIGVRSMLDESVPKRIAIAIGVCAILFSSAGTAVSTMSNYDNSQGVSLRDKRALAQLQQLHWRVVSDVLNTAHRCESEFTKSDQEQQTAWRQRLETILDSAVESVSRPGDLAPPSAPIAAPPVTEPPPSGVTHQAAVSPP